MTDDPKPVVLVDTTANGVPTAAPTRKVVAGGNHGCGREYSGGMRI